MKALVYYGQREIRYMEVDTPEPKPNEVLIAVKAVSICGSDSGAYKNGSAMRVGPLIMGHEFSGVIAKLGNDVKELNVGDRVGVITNLFCGECQDCKDGLTNICNHRRIIGTTMPGGGYDGAMAEYVIAPAEKIMRVPDHVSFNECALVEPLAITLRATKHAGDVGGKTVAVFGAGPIGLLAIQCLKHFKAKRIVAIDLIDERLEMAKQCGATNVANAGQNLTETIFDMTNGLGVDVVMDAVGISATVNSGIEILRNGGTVVWIGLDTPKLEIEYKKAVYKEITFKGSYMYITEMQEGLDLVSNGDIDVKKIITGVYHMSEGERLFNEIASGTSKEIKIILTND